MIRRLLHDLEYVNARVLSVGANTPESVVARLRVAYRLVGVRIVETPQVDSVERTIFPEWYPPHIVGSSQRRLVTEVGSRLASHLPATDGVRLLDVGCGRGGPAIHLADRFGFSVTGLDLVPYNIERATENAREKHVETKFVVGDATQLPFTTGSFAACTAIDALVYLPDRDSVFTAIADVLEPEGTLVLSDLVMQSDVSETERGYVDSFADAWDIPSLSTVEQYNTALDDASLNSKQSRTSRDTVSGDSGSGRRCTPRYSGVQSGLSLSDCYERMILSHRRSTSR